MRLTVFDLDHTLLKVNCSFRFGFFLYKAKFFSFPALLSCLFDYARYKWLAMSIYDLHAKTFARLFKGRSYSETCHLADRFVSESVAQMLNWPVVERLKKRHEAGDYLLILSSSPEFLVARFASYFQVNNWRATSYEINEKGTFTSLSQVMEGEDKARALKSIMDQLNIPKSAVTLYSDSYLDLPVLNMAGRPICVGPDNLLKRVCLKNGWEIL